MKREDIFLVTKLWPTVYEEPDAVEKSLERLDTDYVDLMFLHQPAGNWRAGYRQLEKAYAETSYSRVREIRSTFATTLISSTSS